MTTCTPELVHVAGLNLPCFWEYVLNWRPKVDLETGLKLTIDYFEKEFKKGKIAVA